MEKILFIVFPGITFAVVCAGVIIFELAKMFFPLF
jgi:hypothetical protein